jgi:hypothetical protein
MNEHDRLATLVEIRRLVKTLPTRPDEFGFAGQVEQHIAVLYLRLGELAEAGEWWIRAAQQAEKYNQILQAQAYLSVAMEKVPDHLRVRREFDRVKELVATTKRP